MIRTNLQRAVRALRRRSGLRQSDLGQRAGVSREFVSRLERGNLRGLTLGSIERVADGVGATLDLSIRWRGEQLDRLLDAAHADLQKMVANRLTSLGWLVQVEVSFNVYGDRGRVDVLAFHPGERVILVTEVKSALGDLQDTLGRLDVKTRLAQVIATSAGWSGAKGAVRVLVIADSRRMRRLVKAHDSLFARFSLRGRIAFAWLRRPGPPFPSGLMWFAKLPHSYGTTVRRADRVRTVRRPA